MDTIIVKLNDIIGDISSATEQVSIGAKSISESSITLATGAAEQASSVQELTATIDVINEKTQKNADNSKNATKISETATKNALFGNEEMTKMLSSMEGIKDSSNEISKIINTKETSVKSNRFLYNACKWGEYNDGQINTVLSNFNV